MLPCGITSWNIEDSVRLAGLGACVPIQTRGERHLFTARRSVFGLVRVWYRLLSFKVMRLRNRRCLNVTTATNSSRYTTCPRSSKYAILSFYNPTSRTSRATDPSFNESLVSTNFSRPDHQLFYFAFGADP